VRRVTRLHAGWLGADVSGSEAASADARAQSQAAKDIWRALEALLRVVGSEDSLRDEYLSPETFPETFYTLVRIFVAGYDCTTF